VLNFESVFSRGLKRQRSLTLNEVYCSYLVLFIIIDRTFTIIAAAAGGVLIKTA
jgi:hypothetical protein